MSFQHIRQYLNRNYETHFMMILRCVTGCTKYVTDYKPVLPHKLTRFKGGNGLQTECNRLHPAYFQFFATLTTQKLN